MDKSVIIRNLPKNMYVPELCDNFRLFGNILTATIYCDEAKRSIGEAFIEFEESFSALNAVKSMNNHQLQNRRLNVSLGSESDHFKKVFIKNFSRNWDVCDLLKAFDDIGTIETVNISEENGKSNGFGFVIFKNHSSAKKAIESMNGKIIDGQKLIVERFKNKSERENLAQNSLEHVENMLRRSVQHDNLHVKNLPADFKEDQLKKLFEKYGKVKSVKIAVDGNGVSKQFGFVSFEDEQDAARALNKMNGYPLEDKRLQINFKEDGQLRKQYLSLKSKERDVTIKQYKQRSRSMPKLPPQSLNWKSHHRSSNLYI